jgi:hypothetical protein
MSAVAVQMEFMEFTSLLSLYARDKPGGFQEPR